MPPTEAVAAANGGGGGSSDAGHLEQFLLLAKDTSGKATAAVIQQVLRNRHVFVYGELLDLPPVVQLRDTPDEAWLLVLEIFAYGTMGDYTSASPALPPLGAAQKLKLQQLTVVAECSASRQLPYDALITSCGASDIREVEDLVIGCLYAGLIRGRLNQKDKVLEVHWSMGRDPRPSGIPDMVNSLESWCSRAENVLGVMDANIKHAAARGEERERKTVMKVAHVADAKEQLAAIMAAESSRTGVNIGGGGLLEKGGRVLAGAGLGGLGSLLSRGTGRKERPAGGGGRN